jgi:hypothetical protein
MVQLNSALLHELCRQTIVFRPQEIPVRKLTIHKLTTWT